MLQIRPFSQLDLQAAFSQFIGSDVGFVCFLRALLHYVASQEGACQELRPTCWAVMTFHCRFKLTSLPSLWPTSTSRPLFARFCSAVTFTEWLSCGHPLLFIEHLCSQGLRELALKAPCVQECLLVMNWKYSEVLWCTTEVYSFRCVQSLNVNQRHSRAI